MPAPRAIHRAGARSALRSRLANETARPTYEGEDDRGLPGAAQRTGWREAEGVRESRAERERERQQTGARHNGGNAGAQDRQRQEERSNPDELEPAVGHSTRAPRRAQHDEPGIALDNAEVQDDQEEER